MRDAVLNRRILVTCCLEKSPDELQTLQGDRNTKVYDGNRA